MLFPCVWRSDNAQEFWSEIMREMTRLLGARHIGSSTYHPQSQGAVESMHKTVNTVVKGLVQEHPEGCECTLPFAECILRCSPMADLGKRSPYEVVTGLKPKMPAAVRARPGVSPRDGLRCSAADVHA